MPLQSSQSTADSDQFSSQTLSNISSSFFSLVRGVAWTASSDMRGPGSPALSSDSDLRTRRNLDSDADSMDTGNTPFFDPGTENSPVSRMRTNETYSRSDSPRFEHADSEGSETSQRTRRQSMNLSIEQASGNGETFPPTAPPSESIPDLPDLPLPPKTLSAVTAPPVPTGPTTANSPRSGVPALHLRIPSDPQLAPAPLNPVSRSKKSFTPALSAIPQSPFDLISRHTFSSQSSRPSSTDLTQSCDAYMLDPITFHTLARCSKTNKVFRAVNERQERDRIHNQHFGPEDDSQSSQTSPDNDENKGKDALNANSSSLSSSFFSRKLGSLRQKARSIRRRHSLSSSNLDADTSISSKTTTSNENSSASNEKEKDSKENTKTTQTSSDFGPKVKPTDTDQVKIPEQKLVHNKSLLRRLGVRPRTAIERRISSTPVTMDSINTTNLTPVAKRARPATAHPVESSAYPKLEPSKTETTCVAASTTVAPYDLKSSDNRISTESPRTTGPSNRVRFVKVRTKNKARKDFNALFLAQSLSINNSTPTSPSSIGAAAAAAAAAPASSPPTETVVSKISTANGRRTSISSINDLNQSAMSSSTGQSQGTARTGGKKNAVWTLKFSESGKYLAAAGQDGIIRVWSVLCDPSAREREVAEHDPRVAGDFLNEIHNRQMSRASTLNSVQLTGSAGVASSGGAPNNSSTPLSGGSKSTWKDCKQDCKRKIPTSSTYVPVFSSKPIREYQGHTDHVLDISWSKNDFLLSSSMDKTVRLWHVSRDECLCAFQHLDFVTSIAFHPRDDRYFISGSLDCKLRLWSIHEKRVFLWTEVPELITSVSFSNDGELAFAGTFVGLCFIFETSTLKLRSSFTAKSATGKNSKGRKITSIMPLAGPTVEEDKILVTTNDSRVRLYNLIDKGLEAKFRGHENSSSQIRATFNEDGRYIISGSEDRHVYIWDSGLYDEHHEQKKNGWFRKKEKACYESFQTESNIVTCSIFAPSNTGTFLHKSNDPLFAISSAPGTATTITETKMERIGSSNSGDTVKMPDQSPRGLEATIEKATSPASALDTTSPVTSQYRTKSFSANAVQRVQSGDGKNTAVSRVSTLPTTSMDVGGVTGPENAIIAVADDHTGFIRIYRNSTSWAANFRKNNNSNANSTVSPPETASRF